MSGYLPLTVLFALSDEVTPVDCGTCPVTIACALEQGGYGYVYKCCGSTAVNDGQPGQLLMIDCMRHKFEDSQRAMVQEVTGEPCPLCSGNVLEIEARNLSPVARWVPTVWSKHAVLTRLERWREVWPKMRDRLDQEDERKRLR